MSVLACGSETFGSNCMIFAKCNLIGTYICRNVLSILILLSTVTGVTCQKEFLSFDAISYKNGKSAHRFISVITQADQAAS